MKRIIILALAVVLIGSLLCACGNQSAANIKTTVSSKYDDGYAASYATASSTDDSGNTVYEFTAEDYERYTTDHKNTLGTDIQKTIADKHEEAYGEYAYINTEKQAIIVGVHPEEYDEDTAKAEADSVADFGFKYFQSLETPVDSLKVIYCDANDQESIFGTFDFSVEK